MNGFCGPSLPVGYTVTLKDVSCADNYCTDIHLINSSMTKLHNDSDKESTAIELPFPPNPNRDDVLPVINKEYDVSVMIEFNAEISKLLSNITICKSKEDYVSLTQPPFPPPYFTLASLQSHKSKFTVCLLTLFFFLPP